MKSFFEELGLAFLSPLSTLTIVLSIFNLFQTQCQDEFRSLSGGVTKILTACWIFQISIGYLQEMRMIDFRIFGFFTQLEAGCVGISLRLLLKFYVFFSRILWVLEAGGSTFETSVKRPGPQLPMDRRWATFVSEQPSKSLPEMSAK